MNERPDPLHIVCGWQTHRLLHLYSSKPYYHDLVSMRRTSITAYCFITPSCRVLKEMLWMRALSAPFCLQMLLSFFSHLVHVYHLLWKKKKDAWIDECIVHGLFVQCILLLIKECRELWEGCRKQTFRVIVYEARELNKTWICFARAIISDKCLKYDLCKMEISWGVNTDIEFGN